MGDPDRAKEAESSVPPWPVDAETSRALWRALAESSPDIVLIVDTGGTILFINRVGPPFVGQPVAGGKIWDYATRGSEERIRAILRRLVETREAVRFEAPGLPDPREKVWFEVCAIPLVVDGAVERVLWSATDVTARRTALDTLAFQADVLAQVNQPIVASDGAGLITYWNDAAERLYGWKEAEVLGKYGTALLRARWIEPGGRDAFLAGITADGVWQGEIAQTTKAGDEIVVEASVRLRRDANGKPERAIAVMKDVTERKRLEEQLRQSQKLEAIGLLAGGVAHDFNNLLAIIMGFTEFSIGKLAPGSLVRQQLDEVLAAARRGAELTRKLLAFSRKRILQGRPVEVGAAVEDFARLLARVLGTDIDLSIACDPTPLVVKADTVQLEQVLLNLSINARQAMPDGGQLVLTTRRAGLDDAFVAKNPWARTGTFAEIAVRDTGLGMDAATRARIFEPFFTTKQDGTGLGLSTVYGIVQQHGGFVHVESAPGEGATFRVFLPLAEDAPA